MSAVIVRFIPGARRGRQPTDFPTIVFRSARPTKGPVADEPDRAPVKPPPRENDET
jgi:hypothetical protein